MMWMRNTIQRDPRNLVWHFATGYLPDFLNKSSGRTGWVRWSHRGIQYLDRVVIPRKQKNYIFSPKFELRFDEAFEEVVRATADPGRPGIAKRAGEAWITPELIDGLLAAYRMGFAHSFETWMDGRLVGGIWGVHIGGLVTMSSMFSRVSNASKAAMARGMLHLRDRGFELVDMGMVPDHLVHFGTIWEPQWKYEAMLPRLIRQPLTVCDGDTTPELPWMVRAGEPVVRMARGVRRRLGWRKAPAADRIPAI